ncbi:filamentous hemagglutinin family outer membrane protein [[Leptolyngbya] sp. PCC 7376]|uniref:two-partner secretion domain-containing protein n=1 Tax=[Leptolyngbya] sp. PCC 7376 TaxID=111781 RepID=UPI00029F0E54|nr:filamentous hemagglutinin N-terminal domain-containing protein [[Leptolyngbya] sp. PCC 7376]AFY39953.1 filamentous hemagglutinin family outer membrane protein [[Leptolyngbya] sp. PCC 7376]
MKSSTIFATAIVIASVSFTLIPSPLSAQLLPDGTTTTNILSDQLVRGGLAKYVIGGDSQNGSVLHSFREFNIDPHQRLYFANPVTIDNIITRVTGSTASNILGTLGVDGNASLFLINPHGIFFGDNASLDIDGSLLLSTATDIELDNGTLLSINSAPPSDLLSIDPDSLFDNSLRNYKGQITSEADLKVGESLHISANGILEIQGDINTGAKIHLSTVTGDISTGSIEQYAYDGDIGDINISTVTGDISTGDITQYSYDSEDSENIKISTITRRYFNW